MKITAIEPLTDLAAVNPMLTNLVRDVGAAIPPKSYQALAAHYPSPVDRVVNAAEALYAAAKAAKKGDPRDAMAVACAQLADVCVANQWHELGQTDRGLKVAGACRRLVGLGTQAEADDPEPLEAFAGE